MQMLIFTKNGCLAPGDDMMTREQIEDSVLIHNPEREHWDESWRLSLLKNFYRLATELWQVGIEDIFLDGSFVEEKDHPNDIDGYFVCDFKRFISKELHRELNRINPDKIWTWSHSEMVKVSSVGKRVLPMWLKYRVELFPDYPGSFTGIQDRHGRALGFPEAFRRCRSGRTEKGIIKLIKEDSSS